MNAIVIEQSHDDTKLAFEVHQHAAIDRIRLTRAKVATSLAPEERPASTITVIFSFKSESVAAPPNNLRLKITFRMAGIQKEEVGGRERNRPSGRKPEPAVVVESTYEVDYLLREGFEISPEHVKAFKDGNAIFNLWPYFREYLQDSLQRMGLPPLTAPFLRLQPKPNARKREPRGREAETNSAAPERR